MRTLSILLLLVCVSYAHCRSVSFIGNVSLKGDQDSWQYRQSSMEAWDYDPFDGDGAYFNSVSAGGTKWSAEGDAMWGEASIQTAYPLVAWLAFAEWSVYNKSTDLEVNGANGYVSNAYLSLDETAPNGTVVRRQSLNEGYMNSQLHWDTTDKGVNGELKFVAFTATIQGQPWSIEITFVVSDVVGVIDLANATVSPKSLESIVSITNWPYLDLSNTLSLTMAVATGQSAVKGSGLISGSDASKVYFTLSDKAIVGGSKKSVEVSSFEEANFTSTFGDPNFKAQLQGVYGSKTDCKIVRVTFPAGASDILYDPTIGSGDVVAEEEDNTTSTSTASSPIVVNAVFMLLAFVAVLLL